MTTTNEKKKIFLCSGEVSGDMNGANLVRTIRELAPNFEFIGIGGEKMAAAGVRLLYDSSAWGSIGIFESIAKAPLVYPAMRKLPLLFGNEKPDLFVPIDYRFFNMRAARAAKAHGIPVVYFFAPISWFGTGAKRFVEIAQCVDLSLIALPFSLDDYREAGANFEFIGHPVMDSAHPTMATDEARDFFGVDSARPLFGLMPGSRVQEIKRLLPVFVRASGMIHDKLPGAQFILFRATSKLEPLIKKIIGGAPIQIATEKVHDFMTISDVLILCSGTAAHEATILGSPMVVTYKLSAATAWYARKTLNPPFIALPNVLAGRFVVPELVQEACTPEAVAAAALDLLYNKDAKIKMKQGLAEMKEKLGRPGALAKAANLIVDAAFGNIKLNETLRTNELRV